MSRLPSWVVGSIAGLVLALFLASIVFVGFLGPSNPQDTPGIVIYFLSSVNGLLAANLGAILGISVSAGGLRQAQTTRETLQWVAAAVYVAGLATILVAWGIAGFSEDPTEVASVIPEIGRTSVGILIAVLAAAIGVQAASSRLQNARTEAATEA